MHVPRAVEVLFLHPERADDAAVVLHPVPERPVVGLIGVAAPGAPSREFALGADVQVGAVQECGFGKLVHGQWLFNEGTEPLNPIRRRCANLGPPWARAKLWTA